jgi:ribosomal protein S12 methylthiotransferase
VPVVGFVSLGCAKNLVDSEKMLGQIAESGAVITGDESLADTIVVNTCGFLDAAREEALDVIRELAERKRAGELQRIVVAGCLVQRDGAGLLDEIPEIDALVGVHHRDDVPRAVWGGRANPTSPPPDIATQPVDRYLGDYHPQPWSDRGRLRLTPAHYAYVRISEGCDQKCTFCTIPSIRGPMHSKPADALVGECRELLADGARELVLIGQDTTSYGMDLGDGCGLAGLLRRLDRECDGARWLRLMYVYPTVFTDEMIAAIAECERVVKYIDIPLQHMSDRVLKAMGRRVDRRQQEALLAKLRERIPGVTIRTTFIVGFPGETEAEFTELVDFVRDFRFDALGAFKYSYEPEVPAARIAGRHEDGVIAERYERLMLAQQEVALAAARERVGSELEVVVDGADADGRTVARHAGQAPEVDAVCLLPDEEAEPGALLAATCVDTDGYDLVVRPRGRRLPVH